MSLMASLSLRLIIAHSPEVRCARWTRRPVHRHGRVVMLLWLRLGDRVGRQVQVDLARRKVEWEVRPKIRQASEFR
jgi:hypothetical protein